MPLLQRSSFQFGAARSAFEVSATKSLRKVLQIAFAGLFALSAAPALAQDSYPDPAGSGVIVSTVNWLQGTLMGTFATVAAVIAVASVGFMMLTGRIN